MKRVSMTAGVLAVALLGALAMQAQAAAFIYNDASEDRATYFNVSRDIADIQALAVAGNFDAANQIYSVGRNAYRSNGSFRFAKSVATAGPRHAGEAYYEAFKAYYGTETFLDSWLGAALNGTGPYTDPIFRKHSVITYASVYAWIYMLHEADVGALGITGYTSPTRTVNINPDAVIAEIDDSYALFERHGASCPMKMVEAAATMACLPPAVIEAQLEGIVLGYTAAQAAAEAFKSATQGLVAMDVGLVVSRYTAGRNMVVSFMTRAWVQLALNSVGRASRLTDVGARTAFKAIATASIRAIAPFLNTMRDGGRAVAESLNAINTMTPSSYDKMLGAFERFYGNQGVSVKNSVYACKH